MKNLTYRGAEFVVKTTSIKTAELGLSGTYRGSGTAFRQGVARSIDSALALRYRGNYYLR